ncbi:MAG: SMC-Scp complex subunit ScpB [Sphingobacteriaceae bacterium]
MSINPNPYIEALIFASEQGIRLEEICYCLQTTFDQNFDELEINAGLEEIVVKYQAAEFAIELVRINNGYQFLTKKIYHPIVNQLQIQRSKKKLSQAALETLAIIAYQQPITKLEIEQIRGVNCDYSVQKLLQKELITISGRAETVGKPILYITSNLFMDYFGINSTKELPQLKDVYTPEQQVGENV